jgi:hypothetical protein
MKGRIPMARPRPLVEPGPNEYWRRTKHVPGSWAKGSIAEIIKVETLPIGGKVVHLCYPPDRDAVPISLLVFKHQFERVTNGSREMAIQANS